MLRVVIDTNIILSSLLQPLGPPAQILYLVRCGFLQMCVSAPAYAEYEEVLQRPRFQRIAESIPPMLQFIRENSLWVSPTEAIRVCSDPDDDVFLECAFAARATWLVTGNTRHFPTVWQGIEILTPRSLLDKLSELALHQ